MAVLPTVLITGANGFLGSRFSAHFQACGISVVALVRGAANMAALLPLESKIKIAVMSDDGSNLEEILSQFRPDIVVHAAGSAVQGDDAESSQALIKANVLFPTLLLAAMKKTGVNRLINTGTIWQHYQDKDYKPTALYPATKQAFEDIILHYCHEGLIAVSLHLPDVYGPGDTRPKLIPALLKVAQSGETLPLSPGEQIKDWLYIADVARAYEKAIDHILATQQPGHQIFSLPSEQPVSLKELIETFETTRGVKLPIEWGVRPYHAREMMAPWRSGASLPGWRAQISLAEGLKNL